MTDSEITGTVDFTANGETYQTWYRLLGDLNSGKRPLVTLHGGPGFGHEAMLPHYELHRARGIPVICYDQLGIGKSTHLREKPKEFWSVELFVDELANLVEKLGIAENFDLCGHSWGGMLALSYVLAKQPKGLKRMVLVGTPSSMELWQKGTRELLEGLPKDTRETLKKHEREGTTDSEEYKAGMEVYFRKHMLKVVPEDPTVYSIMNGPSDFYITGTIKSWSVLDDLHKISQETLVINGADDEARDFVVGPLFWRIPKAKWVQFANSSHLAFFEEPVRYFEVVGQFLTTPA
ncbi:proline-specific peptidase [Fomitopsis serialis]|uniref:proline-specific peptidase n=1 Tax=Fomitopsis serialis TaxID=139415 RepID=UPI002008432D|nr:proline-specific peptidase [Neoantrodia serialis]KAH9911383.1 proline-specific peptidase [Neoantrodia serialis]